MEENDLPFSERYGYTRRAMQIESMDQSLRNGLWNAFVRYVWEGGDYDDPVLYSIGQQRICEKIWEEYLKEKVDDFPIRSNVHNSPGDFLRKFRDQFDDSDWYAVYDFLEFMVVNCPTNMSSVRFRKACNETLKREMAAYTIVDGLIAPITNVLEIEAIESAIGRGGPVATQFRSALAKLADRQTPDYRNSIKESISAVESEARRVMGSEDTLGKLLSRMEKERRLPTQLKKVFSTLYGYASGSLGARHGPSKAAGMDEADFDLAKFMLVTCSAFANFLAVKLGNPDA